MERVGEGAAIALFGVVLSVLGLNYMKQAGDGEAAPWRMARERATLWTLAWLAWAFGQILQVVGLWLAPESVVATVANAATPVNAIIASHLFGEHFFWLPPPRGSLWRRLVEWDFGAVLMLTAGAFIVVVSAPSTKLESYTAEEELKLLSGRTFVGTLFVTFAAGCAACARILGAERSERRGRLPSMPALGLAFGTIAGVTGSLSFTATKLWLLLANRALEEDQETSGGEQAWRTPLGGAMLLVSGATTFANMLALFIGLSSQATLVLIPASYITQTLLTAVQELALFSLFPTLLSRPPTLAGFCIGIAMCAWGVCATGNRKPLDGGGVHGGTGRLMAPHPADGMPRTEAPGEWQSAESPRRGPHRSTDDENEMS